ncbi:MAG: hypothetical protein WC730_02370 [Patescibacteria group bacterium]|jgi:SMC interacting uncharacterized protein involved in chromosome segregation
MPNLQEVYKRLAKNKKEKAEIQKMLRGELEVSPKYQEIEEKLKVLRGDRKSLENEVKSVSKADIDRLEELKVDIQTDTELLADIALNMYVEKQEVEIVDDYNEKWYPAFHVTFKKSNE